MTGDELTTVVTDRLRQIGDPCSVAMGSGTDIVSLGLLGTVTLDRGLLTVTLVLTDPSCWFFFDFADAIREQVSDLPGVEEVSVVIDETTIWTPERAVGQRQLPLTVLRSVGAA
jgi:metal-sulfur cluster biosynthetic enzyme